MDKVVEIQAVEPNQYTNTVGAANALGCTPRTIRNYFKLGLLTKTKLPTGRVLVDIKEINELKKRFAA